MHDYTYSNSRSRSRTYVFCSKYSIARAHTHFSRIHGITDVESWILYKAAFHESMNTDQLRFQYNFINKYKEIQTSTHSVLIEAIRYQYEMTINDIRNQRTNKGAREEREGATAGRTGLATQAEPPLRRPGLELAANAASTNRTRSPPPPPPPHSSLYPPDLPNPDPPPLVHP